MMIQLRKMRFFQSFVQFFLLVGIIQLIHGLCGLPYYDLPYLLLITGLLILGDAFRRIRWIAFSLALFLLDLTPGFVLIPIGLFLFVLRGCCFETPQNVSLEGNSNFFTIKMGF